MDSPTPAPDLFPGFEESPPRDDSVNDRVPSGVWSTGAPLLWNQGIKGNDIIIGVIDTGIDDTHPDLQGKVLSHRHYFPDDMDEEKNSYNRHGTHVAGTIAANGSILGVAPEAKLRSYRIFSTQNKPESKPGAIAAAVNDCIKDGVDIINLSIGSPLPDEESHNAIKEAIKAGIFVIVAAGNEGEKKPAPQPSFPGNYHEVVCVAAVNFNYQTGKIESAGFSNMNREVDVACDGVQVYSCVPGGFYAEISGTSMAAPHVSGFSALLLQKMKKFRPELKERTAQRCPALWAALMDNTIDLFDPGLDDKTGAGYVTFYPALPQKDPSTKKWLIPEMTKGAPP